MGETDLAMHYVCTHERARELVQAQSRFWASNCGCREGRGQCDRSRMDVCLIFNPNDPGSGSGKKEVTLADVDRILHEAQVKHLVARPFRNEARTDTDGICFCCDDCCGYFLGPSEKCDKGELIAKTDFSQCSHCEVCVDICYFEARTMNEEELVVEKDHCYGCGLCVDVCPESCIQMVHRV
jgi:Pyruvate/2-oxoacid:ferredoxin oxidoreductase delta subunit